MCWWSSSAGAAQPKSPPFFTVEEEDKKHVTTYTVSQLLSVYFSPCSMSLTLFSDGVHGFHAGFNVVGDVAVEEPGPGVLRTHLHRLNRRKTRTQQESLVLITVKPGESSSPAVENDAELQRADTKF